MYRSIGTIEEDLKLCTLERANQAGMYAGCKRIAPYVGFVSLMVGITIGYFVAKQR